MRPEFINRIDEVISFNQLSPEDFQKICRIMLKDLVEATEHNGIELHWDEALVQYLADKSYSIKYGARNLRRLIEKEVEDKAASLIIEAYEHPLTRLFVTVENGEVKVTGE